MNNEYMIRWKRTAKTAWYYMPMVFHTETEATQRAQSADKTSQFYRVEVVEISPKKVWSTKDGDIQGQAVEQAVPEAG